MDKYMADVMDIKPCISYPAGMRIMVTPCPFPYNWGKYGKCQPRYPKFIMHPSDF
jgi:hypothetical protein